MCSSIKSTVSGNVRVEASLFALVALVLKLKFRIFVYIIDNSYNEAV